MNTDTITLELDKSENLALARLIQARMELLATLPQSKERDEELRSLASVSRKSLQEMAARKRREIIERRALSN